MTRINCSGRWAGLATCLVVAIVSWPVVVSAQDGGEQRTSITVGGGSTHVVIRLNTPNRFYGPLPTADAVRTMAGRAGMARDIEAIFKDAGIPYLASMATQVLKDANPADLRIVSVPVGRRLEWMAQRRGGKPGLVRDVEWRGAASFQAYEFLLDDGVRGYTFLLPQACGNLALAATGPSPRAAAADARRTEEARIADEARRAEEDRRAAEARAAEDARRADEARRAAEARAAEEARRAEDARKAEEARRAEAERQAADAAERDRRARVDVFIAALGGKERRVREITPASGATPAIVGGRCAGLAGVKAGPDIRLGHSNWRVVPAIGVAVNLRETDDTSVFGEAELNYVIADKGFIGTGVGAWDVAHSATRTGSWLLHVGRELGRSANDVRVLAVAEGRLFFDQLDDIDNNYQAWAGLRIVFR